MDQGLSSSRRTKNSFLYWFLRWERGFLHLFEWAIRMLKWLMPVACHMFTYTLKDSARIWWNSQKIGSILNYEDLKARFRSHFSQQKKFTKTHLAVHNIKQREGESTRAFITRYIDDTLQILGLHEEQKISGFVLGLRTRSLVEHLSTNLPSTYKANWSKDKTRYYHFHEDYRHETNQCQELKHQTEEAVKSGQLAHLVKGVKEKKEKTTGTRSEERKKEEKKPTLDKVSVLMISGKNCNVKKRHVNYGGIGEITFPSLPNVGSSDPVIIKVYISGRQVNRIPLSGLKQSSCRFLTRTVMAFGRNTLGGYDWRGPHRGTVVSTVHGAIKFHTPRGIGTIFSEYNSQKPKEKEDGPTNKYQGNEENVLSCIDTEERVVINDKYQEQKITIGRQLPTRIKIRLRDLLKRYTDVFAWTSAHIIGVPRVLMIGGETFNTEHRINMFNHAEPVKQKKRSLASERNKAVHNQKDIGKWKLRVDFTNINKACIRETHSLPAAEQKEEGLHKYRLKCFLDAYNRRERERSTDGRKGKETNPRILRKKLIRYFQAHPIQVLNDKLIKQILAKPEKSGRIAKWAIELGEHEIEFKGRNSIKGQILADFLAETPLTENKEAKNEEVKIKEPEPKNAWKLFTGEASSSNGSGAGLMVVSPEGKEYTYALRFEFVTTNNEAKYEALLAVLRITKEMEIRELIIFLDSQLVENQVKGIFEARQPTIKQYLEKMMDLLSGALPNDPQKARKLCIKAPLYKMVEEKLYRRSYLSPWLRCVRPMQAKKIIKEVHEGSCGMNSGLRIDIVGPLPTAPGGARFLVVAIDYFTKWVEAKPLISITGKHMEKFVWEHTMCRFGRPQAIILDNGKQFVKGTFPAFYTKLGMKRRLGKAHQAWIYELPQVLMAHRTMPKSSNGETPFSLVYGSEAVIPIEISVETKPIQDFDPKENEKRLREDLDILEERREMASIRVAHYIQKLEGYYNKNVKPSTFKPGTYVLRLNSASKAEYQGKIRPTWEGPYVIRKAYGDRAYKLETLSGEAVDRTWNRTNLYQELEMRKRGVVLERERRERER
ncbi:reverse transcriptase domain-containing protein [Tanacetum coccineum]